MLTLYVSGTSWLHRTPAGFKLLFLALFSTLIYQISSPLLLLIPLSAVVACYFTLATGGWRYLGVVRPLFTLFILLFALQWWSVSLTAALVLLCRMLMLIWMAHLLTLTTPMQKMMDAMMPVFRPFRIVGIRPERLSFAVVLLIRFVPVLMALVSQLTESWKARAGGRRQWQLVIPMVINAIRISDQVAESLAARGGISPVSHLEVSDAKR